MTKGKSRCHYNRTNPLSVTKRGYGHWLRQGWQNDKQTYDGCNSEEE